MRRSHVRPNRGVKTNENGSFEIVEGHESPNFTEYVFIQLRNCLRSDVKIQRTF